MEGFIRDLPDHAECGAGAGCILGVNLEACLDYIERVDDEGADNAGGEACSGLD